MRAEPPPAGARRRLYSRFAGLLAGLACLASFATAGKPIEVWPRPVPLSAEAPELRRAGRLEFLAGFDLSSPNPGFGGFSGLVLAADGRGFHAVTDRGNWLTGRLRLDAEGRLTGIEAAELLPMLFTDGRALAKRGRAVDAEAVERLPDGALVVSFEQRHRVWRYADTAAIPRPYAEFPELKLLPENGGIEAMVALGDGRLLLLAEAQAAGAGLLQGWLWSDGTATPLRYAARGGFKPTDAARLPNGDVLVLERSFSLLGGFSSRLARLDAAAPRPHARLEGEEIALLAWPLVAENFEALAVAPSPAGPLVYLLSDNNFNAFQDTLLLQFRLLP